MAILATGMLVLGAISSIHIRVRTRITGTPIACRVALCAICTKHTGMECRLGMAGNARRGCAFIDTIDMTCGALDAEMGSSQFEGCQVMVKAGWQPSGGGVATSTVGTIAATMMVSGGMAGITGGGSTLVNSIDMAAQAGHVQVLPGQFEGCQVMVKAGRQPSGSGVATSTVGAIAATMMVSGGMASITGGGSALVDTIDMAVQAGHVQVPPGQFESRQVMVKAGR
jgi:hypothetical protein